MCFPTKIPFGFPFPFTPPPFANIPVVVIVLLPHGFSLKTIPVGCALAFPGHLSVMCTLNSCAADMAACLPLVALGKLNERIKIP